MTIGQNNEKRIRELRERRAHNAKAKDDAEKRAKYGDEIVAKLNALLGANLLLDDFDMHRSLPIQLVNKADFRDYPGQVIAHTNLRKIREVVSCCDAIIGNVSGVISFDEYEFIGVAEVKSTTLAALLNLARSVHDSVLFCPAELDSVILLNHYEVSGVSRDMGYSLVIQGAKLEDKLSKCFENIVQFESKIN